MQRAWISKTGFTLHAAQCGSVPGETHKGGTQRPPEGRLQPMQVGHTKGYS